MFSSKHSWKYIYALLLYQKHVHMNGNSTWCLKFHHVEDFLAQMFSDRVLRGWNQESQKPDWKGNMGVAFSNSE